MGAKNCFIVLSTVVVYRAVLALGFAFYGGGLRVDLLWIVLSAET